MNRFYIFKDNDKFITVKDLKIGFSRSIDKAAYWHNKDSANTWLSKVLKKFPNASLEEVKFTLV